MRTQTTLTVVGAACALLLAGAKLSATDVLPGFFFPFPPPADSAEVTSIPLRPPDDPSRPAPPRQRSLAEPRKPPFALSEGDRVLFLGDQLLRGELEFGHWETRLTSQYPNSNLAFRNLSWLTNHPLLTPLLVDHGEPADRWLEPILNHVARIRPTVVFLGFGTEAAAAGEPGLDSFRTNLNRLIDGLLTSPDSPPPRLVILSPLSSEPGDPPTAGADEDTPPCAHYAQVLWDAATSRQCEFIDLYRWSQAERQAWHALPESDRNEARALTKDGLRLTQYGYWRLTLAWEPGLRWAPNNWRFGYLTDGSLRDGQFGIELVQRSRSGRQATATTIEARLPTPNPPRIDDIDPAPRPQCYIQITGLDPGDYALHVDGQRIVQGNEAEWARYQIIGKGPSWDQAERLRQTIVRKNTLLLSHWLMEDPSQLAGDPDDPQIHQLEAQIATLRKPVLRTYEVRPATGDSSPIRRSTGPTPRRPLVPPQPGSQTPP